MSGTLELLSVHGKNNSENLHAGPGQGTTQPE